MNIIKFIKEKVAWSIEFKVEEIKHNKMCKKYKKKYPGWDELKWIEDLEMIWGITSCDNLNGNDANMYTLNDIDICHNHTTGMYSLGIETAYLFHDTQAEIKYLKRLHDAFTNYMIDNGFSTVISRCFYMSSPITSSKANSIEGLYENFTVFVNGYEATYSNRTVMKNEFSIGDQVYVIDTVKGRRVVIEEPMEVQRIKVSICKGSQQFKYTLFGENKRVKSISGKYMFNTLEEAKSACEELNKED